MVSTIAYTCAYIHVFDTRSFLLSYDCHMLMSCDCHMLLCPPLSHEGQVRHYHIKQDEANMYWISEKHRFSTIGELVQYHKSNGGGVCYSSCDQ